MPPDDVRSEKRLERYRELRALGFSAEDARRLRDRSGRNIQLEVASEQRRISRKPQRARTPEETFRLRRIQDRNVSATRIQQEARLNTRRERWMRFSEWSKAGVFPRQYISRIRQINIRAGRDAYDGYGFRQFYFEYVERLSREESIELADRADSGMRYLVNRPLVPGRINLRRDINPPKSRQGVA